METTKKVTVTQKAAPAEETKKEKQPAGRKAAIEAFMALAPADRMYLYSELGNAINHDQDMSSQGLEVDNAKYEALLK